MRTISGSMRNLLSLWLLTLALGLSWTLLPLPALARDYFIFPEEVWSHRYPANAGHKWPVTLQEASRGVYVTGIAQVDHGSTNQDFVTVKYDSGQEEWEQFYNGTGNGDDIAVAMVQTQTSQRPAHLKPSKKDKFFRSGGHLYVTGTSKGVSGTGSDFLTVKYTSSGNKLWERRYNSIDDQDEIVAALAVDHFHNVFVTGTSGTFGLGEGGSNYLTIKYNASGAKVWEAFYDGNGATYNLALANAVDEQGNVYVSGYSGDLTHLDILTVKFGPDGTFLWEQRHPGPAPWTVIAGVLDNFMIIKVMLALDTQGNILVAGPSLGDGTGHDYATIKYSSSGSKLWEARYNNPNSNRDDIPTAMALDAQNNVYVTGYSEYMESSYQMVTFKYDNSGIQQDSASYNADGKSHANFASALALDGAGNVYVAGESEGDFLTIRYKASTLEQEWVKRETGPNGDSRATDIMCIPGSADLYVTGYSKSQEEEGYDIFTIQYHQVSWYIVIP